MKNQSKFKKFGTKLQAQRAIISKNRWGRSKFSTKLRTKMALS